MATQPQILSIQHFCVHDGPGIRSVVFIKGCPLRCVWCQNPESWSLDAELAHKRRQCIECGTCVETCPEGAMEAPGQWSLDTCTNCFACVETCPGGALTRFGKPLSAAEALAELAKEYSLYHESGGGVTFSGGEASLFPQYLVSMLGPLRRAGVHTAIETCGLFRLKHLRPVDELIGDRDAWREFSSQILWRAIGELDLVLFDLKIIDNDRHREYCGADNRHILDNFRLLAALANSGHGPEVWPRMPLVPGVTDDEANVRAVARMVRESGLSALTLLPYHNLGAEKLDWLRKPDGFREPMLSPGRLARAREIVADEGLQWFESGDEALETLEAV